MGLSMPQCFSAHPLYFGPGLSWLADMLTTVGKTGMAGGGLFAFILDNTIPGIDEERGLIAWVK